MTGVAVLVGLLAVGTVPGGVAADHADSTGDRIQIVDATQGQGSNFPAGEIVVAVKATTDEPIEDIQFHYDNGTESGSLTFANGGIEQAFYDDLATGYGSNDAFNRTSGSHGIVFFELSGSWDTGSTVFNASAGGSSYATADRANRSVMTANAYSVSLVNATGDSITATTPLFLSNSSSQTLQGYTFVSGGAAVFNCGGVIDGSSCIDPDTNGEAHTYQSGGSVSGGETALPTSLEVQAFELATSNGSAATTLAPGSQTLRTDTAAAPTVISVEDYSGGSLSGEISEVRIENETGATVQKRVPGVAPSGPLFLEPKTDYDVVVEQTDGQTDRRPITIPTQGVSNIGLRVANSSTPTSEVIGQVINESSSPVANATVTAEPVGSSGNPPSYNSTRTNEQGVFRMELPETDATNRRYQFKLASSQTDGGTLTYFPTRADSQGDGYRVRDSRTILSQLTIKQGGEVDITVTNATGGKISSSQALTSLSQTTTATGDRTRSSLVESFGLFAFPDTSVSESLIRVPSPTTGVEDDVSYNVWGLSKSASIGELCAQQVDVSQGSRTTSDCQLTAGGTLSITLDRYDSIVNDIGSQQQSVGSSSFFNQNLLLVRNATSGNVTTVLGPGSIQQYFITGSQTTLSLPVPAGNYTVELRPTNQFVDRTSVRNRSTVEVSTGATGTATLDSGRDFVVRPDFDRTDRSFRRTGDNTIAVTVADPATGSLLNGSEINLNASLRLFYRNGTAASDPVSLSYNTTADSFDNTSYTPAVDAGEYRVQLKATYEEGDSSYNTTVSDRLRVSDFATSIQTERRTVAPGESFQAGLRAYDQSAETAISADASNITLVLYNRDGTAIGRRTPDSGITNGEGTIDIPAVNETGIYRIGVSVTADDGRQGIANTWIRVSEYDVDVELDRSVYALDDVVTANVTLVNSTSGNAVSGASIETTAFSESDQASLTNTTDANGEATVTLDPDSLFSDSWSRPAFIGVEATVDTPEGLLTIRDGTGIPVRAFQTDVSAAQAQFESGENATIDVAVPPGTNVDASNVTATQINGQEINVTGTSAGTNFFRISLDSDLSTYGVDAQGAFRVTVEVTNDKGATATDRARFAVSSLNVRAEPDARSYTVSEDVTVQADVRFQNGSPASGESVTMNLTSTNPERLISSNTTQTATNGRTTAQLSPQSDGIHRVVVSAGGSTTSFPVLISNITTNFTDGTDPVESYEFTPGQTGATINISAENATGPIDGQMVVRALINGRPTELGSSSITDGTAGISFSIPESANTGTYPVEVFVRSASGGFDTTTSRIELTPAADTPSIDTEVQDRVYEPGETAEIQATVTNSGGPISGKDVEFTLVSASTERTLTTGTTGADGTVTVKPTVPTDLTDGEYGVRATITGEGITAYSGFFLSNTQLSITTNESAYAAGDTILANLSATTDGNPVSAARGGVRIRLADGSTVTESFDSTDNTGGSYYEVAIDIPEDDAAIGTRTVDAYVRNGSSVATTSTTVDVFNGSENASLSVPETIIANDTAFNVTGNSTVATTGTLTVFSPGTASVTYEEELSLNATTSLSIADPGTYVFSLSVPGVGTETVVRNVDSGPNDPTVEVGTDLSTNATEFATSDDIYIRTDANGMTAEVLTPNDSTTVPLNREDGATNYGVVSASETTTGPYLVRLDGPNSTDVDSVLIEVTSE